MTEEKPTPYMVEQITSHHAPSLTVAQATELLNALISTVTELEEVSIGDSLNRVIALDVISPIDVPAHDNSAMDGYAFDGSQLKHAQNLTLTVIGTALAGKAWQGQPQAGECIKIMTGAVMPTGLNTVVPQEFCTLSNQQISFDTTLVSLGQNRRMRGEDLQKDVPAVPRGAWVTPAVIGLLASLGLTTVKVVKRLRVAYFSTGDEILSLGEEPREGAVYDSNRYTLMGLLKDLGCTVLDLGIVPDDPISLESTLQQAVQLADIVITSGGVSGGDADFTKATLQKMGKVDFWKIAIKPGRPMAVGQLQMDTDRALLFGLPGNPVAAMITFLAIVKPALLKMMGVTDAPPPLLRAKAQEMIPKKPGRTEYQRGVVSRNDLGELLVKTTGNQGSGILSSMVQANCLIVLAHAQSSAEAGDWVDVLML